MKRALLGVVAVLLIVVALGLACRTRIALRLMERVGARGIPYESALPPEYLRRVVAAYDEFFRLYTDSPVLVVDTSGLDYSSGGPDVVELIGEIEQTRSGCRRYAPGEPD